MSYNPHWDLLTQPLPPGGDVQGTFPALSLSATGVTPGTYGQAQAVPQLTVDHTGRITAITNVPITALPVDDSIAEYTLPSLPASIPVTTQTIIITATPMTNPATVFTVSLDLSATSKPRLCHIIYHFDPGGPNTAFATPVPLILQSPWLIVGAPTVDVNTSSTHRVLLWPNTRMTLLILDAAAVLCLAYAAETSWYEIPAADVAPWFDIIRHSDQAAVGPQQWNMRRVQWRARTGALDVRYHFQFSGGAVANTSVPSDFYLWRFPSFLSNWFNTMSLAIPVMPTTGLLPVSTNEAPPGHFQNHLWLTTGSGPAGHGIVYPHIASWTEGSSTRYGMILSMVCYADDSGYKRIHAYGTPLSGSPPPLGVQDDVYGSFLVSIPFHIG